MCEGFGWFCDKVAWFLAMTLCGALVMERVGCSRDGVASFLAMTVCGGKVWGCFVQHGVHCWLFKPNEPLAVV